MLDMIEERYELVSGREIMLAQPAINHITIAGNLNLIIRRYLKGKHCRVYAEADVYLDEQNHYVPDLLIVCDRNKIKATHIEGAPDLVVEIISPSTGSRDYGVKKDIYEKFGVKEYWIIDPKSKSVLVYLLKDGRFQFDNRYAVLEDWEEEAMNEQERAEHKLKLKVSLYNDLEIEVKEIFEDMI